MIIEHPAPTLFALYDVDETAWLEEMARLASTGQVEQLDLAHLGEYLCDMAKRDKREVVSRLTVLMCHLLKWEHQPNRRSKSWESTIRTQRRELEQILESAVLRNHALQEWNKIYDWAVVDAASETDLPHSTFPETCPFTMESVLGENEGATE